MTYGGENMDGILLIDKPAGPTSHDVVFRMRKATGESRIGHTGTLDPLATGLLVLCLGRAAKLVKYLTEHDKTYHAEIVLGYRTDTLDAEGTVLEKKPCPPIPESRLDEVLQGFLGTSEQVPPLYSALKVEGKKLYEYARDEEEVPRLGGRPVEVYALERLTPLTYEGETARFAVRLHCGKGFYVRSFARDLGQRLGIPAMLGGLRRETVGPFSLSRASTLSDALEGKYALLDPFPFLGMPLLRADPETKRKVANGMFLPPLLFSRKIPTIVTDETGKPLAIYEYDERIDKMRLSVLW